MLAVSGNMVVDLEQMKYINSLIRISNELVQSMSEVFSLVESINVVPDIFRKLQNNFCFQTYSKMKLKQPVSIISNYDSM